MKYTRITEDNINVIAKRLQKFFARHACIESQTNWGWIPKLRNKLGITALLGIKEVEYTMVHRIVGDMVKVEVDNCFSKESYIRITYSKASASLLNIGDEIKLTSTHLITRTAHLFRDNITKYLCVYKVSNKLEEAIRQTSFEEHTNSMYELDDFLFEVD